MSERIVTLEIGCWAFAIGGEHYYGDMYGYVAGGFKTVPVTKKLSAKDARALNKKDETRAWSKHRPGDESERFDSEAEVRRAALSVWKAAFPDAEALNEGSFACCDPQRVLDGPEPFKGEANKLAKRFDDIGGYEKNPKEADRLFERYQSLLKTYFTEPSLAKS